MDGSKRVVGLVVGNLVPRIAKDVTEHSVNRRKSRCPNCKKMSQPGHRNRMPHWARNATQMTTKMSRFFTVADIEKMSQNLELDQPLPWDQMPNQNRAKMSRREAARYRTSTSQIMKTCHGPAQTRGV